MGGCSAKYRPILVQISSNALCLWICLRYAAPPDLLSWHCTSDSTFLDHRQLPILEFNRRFCRFPPCNFFALCMRVQLIHRVVAILLVLALLLSHARVCSDENSCGLCKCCNAESCMLSFSAPPCCASCEAASSEATLNEALPLLEQVRQALRAHAQCFVTLVYPSQPISRFCEDRSERFMALAAQPPLHLRCEVLLI
jgi:hypothetical protein